jgi:glycosyltransferase involved in cell wall biosynthesis
MKKISILVPCYNEVGNVVPLCDAIVNIMEEKLSSYDYEILFIDNCSTDGTRPLLRELCGKNKKVKAIFNTRNFARTSTTYGLLQTTGNCIMLMAADFQIPVELIPDFVKEWENGYKIVVGIKNKSKENKLMYFIRTIFYKLLHAFSETDQIEHFCGCLYDKSVLDIIRNIHDSTPYLRGIITDLGFKRKEISFTQPKRRSGKSHYSLYDLYDIAMMAFTSYTKAFLRIPIFLGFGIGIISFLVALYYLIIKLFRPGTLSWGMAPAVIGIFFIGALQLIFIGLLGEYVMAINRRAMNRPLVIEEERINFEEEK